MQIAVFAASSLLRSQVRTVRRWCMLNREKVGADLELHVGEFHTLPDAAGWQRKAPQRRILLTVGCSLAQLEEEYFPDELDRFELIVHDPPRTDIALSRPTASLVEPPLVVTFKSPIVALRKSLLRLSARRVVSTLRRLDDLDEFRDYSQLRYSVWSGLGYLDEETDCRDVELELNYSDRTAIPFGVFDYRDKLVGCARLVRGFGMESPHDVGLIEELIAESKSGKLAHCVEYPAGLNHPFDMLEAFPNFTHYYRRLVRENVPKAEVSRVIIAPSHQHQRLGEVLVDSLVSCANSLGLTTLFLACRQKHEKFYSRSGFRRIANLEAHSFIKINAPSIAMERCDDGSRSTDALKDIR